MTDIQAWLDKGKRRMELISSGPWELREIERHGRITTQVHVSFDYGDLEIQGPRTVIDDEFIEGNNARFIADARTRLPQAVNALQEVLDMHVAPEWVKVQRSNDGSRDICQECTTEDTLIMYPCRTVRAIQDAIGEQR